MLPRKHVRKTQFLNIPFRYRKSPYRRRSGIGNFSASVIFCRCRPAAPHCTATGTYRRILTMNGRLADGPPPSQSSTAGSNRCDGFLSSHDRAPSMNPEHVTANESAVAQALRSSSPGSSPGSSRRREQQKRKRIACKGCRQAKVSITLLLVCHICREFYYLNTAL